MNDVLPTIAAQEEEPTEEQRAQLEAWFAAHPFGDQDENGIDLSILRLNLQRSPTERLRRLERGSNSLLALKNATRIHSV